jgi:hypothetical protein
MSQNCIPKPVLFRNGDYITVYLAYDVPLKCSDDSSVLADASGKMHLLLEYVWIISNFDINYNCL